MSLDHESQNVSHPSDQDDCQLKALAGAAPNAVPTLDLDDILGRLSYCVGAVDAAGTMCFDNKVSDIGSVLRVIQRELETLHLTIDNHLVQSRNARRFIAAFESRLRGAKAYHA